VPVLVRQENGERNMLPMVWSQWHTKSMTFVTIHVAKTKLVGGSG
jgi:hypothetical protein